MTESKFCLPYFTPFQHFVNPAPLSKRDTNPKLLDPNKTGEYSLFPELEQQTHMAQSIPLRRFGTPEEVADAVAFLAKNPYVNGCHLTVDGGLTANMVGLRI